jgi:hypothetical protein
MAAHRRHPATPNRLLILLLGITSVVAACGGNHASPTAITPPPTSGTTASPTSDTLSRGEAAKLFNYNRQRPLAITRLALTTRLSANELRGVTVESITYASPKGGGGARPARRPEG